METPATDKAPLTADEIRHQMTEQFKLFEPHLTAYHDYAERMAALSQEYHERSLSENWPGAQVEELTLAASLDTRHTPKSLDAALDQLREVKVKRIIFDRVKSTYFLYV